MDILTVTRSCAATVLDATEQQISDVVANLPRLETVATCGVVTVTARGAHYPFALDLKRDVLLTGLWSDGAMKKLYARCDPGTAPGTLLVDTEATVGQPGYHAAIAAFLVLSSGAKYVRACVVTGAGTYLLAMGRATGYNGTLLLGAIFRSSDGGITWANVSQTTNGMVAGPGSMVASAARVVYGTYADPAVANCSLLLSTDDGATFVEIWTQTAVAMHVHRMMFDPVLTTRLWVTFGDQPSRFGRIDLVDNVGTVTYICDAGLDKNLDFNSSDGCFVVDDEVFFYGGECYAYNPTTGAIRNFLYIPTPVEGANTAYGYWGERTENWFRWMQPSGGIIYATVSQYTHAANCDGGILVSPDNGRHWSRAYWTEPTNGVKDFVTTPWRGELWARLQDADGVTESMISFRPPQTITVLALRLEGAVTNALTIEGSTFTTATGAKASRAATGWAASETYNMSAALRDESIVTDGTHGANCLEMVGAAGTSHVGGIDKAGGSANAGDKVTFLCRVKAGAGWPKTHRVIIGLASNGGTIEMSGSSTSLVWPSEGEWMPMQIEGKCTAPGTFRINLQVRSCAGKTSAAAPVCTFNATADSATPATGTWANGTAVRFRAGTLPSPIVNSTTYYVGDWDGTKFCIYSDPDLAPAHKVDLADAGSGTSYVYVIAAWTLRMDAAMVVIDAANWYAGSFQPGGTARTAEYADATLTGLPAAGWTVGIEWRPESGYKEYSADLGILSIGDGTHWMDLTWDASEAKFLLTDDGGQSGSQAAAMKWRHFDDLRLILTSDGTDTWLYVRDPANGIQAALKCTAVNIGKPSTLRIGANHDASLGAAGRFFNVWKEARKWSATEVANEAPYPGATVADGVYDYTPRGAAELLGVGR